MATSYLTIPNQEEKDDDDDEDDDEEDDDDEDDDDNDDDDLPHVLRTGFHARWFTNMSSYPHHNLQRWSLLPYFAEEEAGL